MSLYRNWTRQLWKHRFKLFECNLSDRPSSYELRVGPADQLPTAGVDRPSTSWWLVAFGEFENLVAQGPSSSDQSNLGDLGSRTLDPLRYHWFRDAVLV